MLDSTKELLPLRRDDCNAVQQAHKRMFPNGETILDSLQRRFASLHPKTLRTVDPLMPPKVKRGKHICFKLTECANMGVMDVQQNELVATICKCLILVVQIEKMKNSKP